MNKVHVIYTDGSTELFDDVQRIKFEPSETGELQLKMLQGYRDSLVWSYIPFHSITSYSTN